MVAHEIYVQIKPAPFHREAPQGRTDVLIEFDGCHYATRYNFPIQDTIAERIREIDDFLRRRRAAP